MKRQNRIFQFLLFLGLVLCSTAETLAQPQAEAPVGFTRARSYRVPRTVQLTGTVESRLISRVASEIPGLVVDFPVRVGDSVNKDDVLARLRRQTLEMRLEEARAQLREDEARLSLAERTLDRTRELLEKGAVSEQQLDDRLFEFNALERRAERLKVVIEQLQVDLDRTVIRAPFSGVVVRENTQLGEWLEVGGEVVELMSLDDLEVSVDLPERYFGDLRVGSRAGVTFDALPSHPIAGQISAIIPQADTSARTFPIKIRLPDLGGRIGVGAMAHIELLLGRSPEVTIVPKDAVVGQSGSQVVYVVDGDGLARMETVQTGRAVGAWVEVSGAVRPGQSVVTRGNERLRNGQKVRETPDPTEYQLP